MKDGRTWFMHRDVREVRSWTDYILFTGSNMFQNVAVWDARHNTDHYLVLGCLCRAAPDTHLLYLGKRTCFPIRPPANPENTDRIFAKLLRSIPSPPLTGTPPSGLDLT